METREANEQYGRPRKRAVRKADNMLGKSKNTALNSVEMPRDREPETLSPPSNAYASNQVRATNVLPPGKNELLRL